MVNLETTDFWICEAFIRFAWRSKSSIGRQLNKSWLVKPTTVVEAMWHFDVLSIAHRSGIVVVLVSSVHRCEFHTLLTRVDVMDRVVLRLLVVGAAVNYLTSVLVVMVANRVEPRRAGERRHRLLLRALDAHDLVSSVPCALLQSSPLILAEHASPAVDPVMLLVT